MDFFQSPNHTHTTKRHKKRLTQNQVRLLEISFNHDKKLDPERKFQLARDLGLPPRQVAIWYQNKRARWKTQTLELDYKAIQLRLESTLADKRRLEKEVRRLNGELQKAHEMLLGLNTTALPIHEHGNSSLHWEDNSQVLQVEALYACMMGVEDQTTKSNRPD